MGISRHSSQPSALAYLVWQWCTPTANHSVEALFVLLLQSCQVDPVTTVVLGGAAECHDTPAELLSLEANQDTALWHQLDSCDSAEASMLKLHA
jgi:hypothetical protein